MREKNNLMKAFRYWNQTCYKSKFEGKRCRQKADKWSEPPNVGKFGEDEEGGLIAMTVVELSQVRVSDGRSANAYYRCRLPSFSTVSHTEHNSNLKSK